MTEPMIRDRPGQALPAAGAEPAGGPGRDAAVARMRRALSETTVTGPGLHTTAGFLHDLLGSSAFGKARHSTSYVDELTGS